MIRVVMADNKPVETYKTGTKFAIHQATGNLSVYNDAKEEIAVHAHGTWASVSVEPAKQETSDLTLGSVSDMISKAIRSQAGSMIADQINDPNSAVSRALQKNLTSGRNRY